MISKTPGWAGPAQVQVRIGPPSGRGMSQGRSKIRRPRLGGKCGLAVPGQVQVLLDPRWAGCAGRASLGRRGVAVWPRGGSRPRRGSLGAGWARRIAKGCGLARIAEPRRKRRRREGFKKKKKKEERETRDEGGMRAGSRRFRVPTLPKGGGVMDPFYRPAWGGQAPWSPSL